ncbi:MAG: hypothetical protein ACYDBY_01085 [Thermoanaerobaculia bacterium]
MTILLRLVLRGPLDRDALSAAVSTAAVADPLLTARADLAVGCWLPSASGPEALVTLGQAAPGPAPDPRFGPGLRVWTIPADGRTELWLELHHAACDGRSAFRFASDVLAAYRRLCDGEVPPAHSTSAWADLASRDRRPAGGPGRLLALVGAARFLGREPVSLTGRPQPRSPSPPVVARTLPEEGTRALRTLARELGVSLNTLLLCRLFQALAAFQGERGPFDRLRIAVPVALDRHGPTAPSAPRVSMVFLDRMGAILSRHDDLIRSVAAEMATIRLHGLEPSFLTGLALARRLPGGLDRAIARTRPWATAVMTKIDEPLSGNGSDLVEDVLVLSPVRPGTALAIGAVLHRGRLSLAARFDPVRLSAEDAGCFVEALLDLGARAGSSPGRALRGMAEAC